MKKIALWLSSVLLVASLSACGGAGNSKSGDADAAKGNNGSKTESAASGPAKIKFYTFKPDKAEEPYYQAVKAFNESQDDVEVEYVSLVQNSDSVEFMTKLDVLMAGGEVVDVFQTGNEEMLMERAARGVVEPLDSYYEKAGLKPQDEYVKNPSLDGKTYGIIASATQWMTVFNKEHLDAAGLKLPDMGWTWDDFRQYAKQLTTEDHYGAYFHTWGEYPNIIAYTERPHPQLKEDLTPLFDDPSFEYFFQLRRAMETEDKSVEPYADVLASNYHVLQQFFAGNASMLAVPSYAVRAGLNLERFPHEFQMAYAPLPRSVDAKDVGYTNISGSYLAMGTKSTNKDASFTFMRWLSTEGAKYIQDFPGWKKADGEALLNEFFGDKTDLIDIASLSSTLFDPRNKMPESTVNVAYGAELKTVVENGFTSFMLDNKPFEEVKKSMTEEAEKIVAANR